MATDAQVTFFFLIQTDLLGSRWMKKVHRLPLQTMSIVPGCHWIVQFFIALVSITNRKKKEWSSIQRRTRATTIFNLEYNLEIKFENKMLKKTLNLWIKLKISICFNWIGFGYKSSEVALLHITVGDRVGCRILWFIPPAPIFKQKNNLIALLYL